MLTEHVRARYLTRFLQQLHELMWWMSIVFVCSALFSPFWFRAPLHTHPAPSFRNLLSALSQCGSDGHYPSHKPLLTLCHREAHDPGQAKRTTPSLGSEWTWELSMCRGSGQSEPLLGSLYTDVSWLSCGGVRNEACLHQVLRQVEEAS